MFRPIRTLIMMAMVFISGVFYERFQHGERCVAAGGVECNQACVRGRPDEQ